MFHKYMSTAIVFNPLPGFESFCPFQGEVVPGCGFLVFITYAFSQMKLENQRIYSFESCMFIFHVDSETHHAASRFSLLFLTQFEYLSCFISVLLIHLQVLSPPYSLSTSSSCDHNILNLSSLRKRFSSTALSKYLSPTVYLWHSLQSFQLYSTECIVILEMGKPNSERLRKLFRAT